MISLPLLLQKKIPQTSMAIRTTVRASMDGKRLTKLIANVTITKDILGLKAVSCQRFVMYGVVATESIIM